MAELSVREVALDGAEPGSWLAILHGIYGAGRNWNSVARRFVRERPEWGATLVDLREHGASRGFGPPHTVEAAARDLLRTARAAGGAPHAVLGHSFGGKVALDYLRITGEESPDEAPAHLWVVDSTPAPRDPEGSAWEMLHVLRASPGPFESRDDGVSALEAGGVATPVARWMATNLVEGEDGGGGDRAEAEWRWRIDADVMEALLRDFFARDLWATVEDPPADASVHLVKAEESSVLSGDALERAERAAAASDRVHLHRVDGGHWVNADSPDSLVSLLSEWL